MKTTTELRSVVAATAACLSIADTAARAEMLVHGKKDTSNVQSKMSKSPAALKGSEYGEQFKTNPSRFVG